MDAGADVSEALYLLRRAQVALGSGMDRICSLAARGKVKDGTVVAADTARHAIRLATEKVEDLQAGHEQDLW
jgi:hypothetical protein